MTITSSIRSSFHKSNYRETLMKKGSETSNKHTAKLYIFKYQRHTTILTILTILNTLTSLHNHFMVAGTPTPTLQSTSFFRAKSPKISPLIREFRISPPKDHEQVFFLKCHLIFICQLITTDDSRWFSFRTSQPRNSCFLGDHRKTP